MPDRLLVDLGGDRRAVVSSWPDGGLPEEVARAPLTWPLDASALEDLRWSPRGLPAGALWGVGGPGPDGGGEASRVG